MRRRPLSIRANGRGPWLPPLEIVALCYAEIVVQLRLGLPMIARMVIAYSTRSTV